MVLSWETDPEYSFWKNWNMLKARGAKIYGEIVGYGATGDAYHMTAPCPDGDGAARAIRLAMDEAGITPEQVDYINAHGTSTHANDAGETAAIKLALGDAAAKVAVSSTKSMTGHLLGAAGAIEAIACVKALEEGFRRRRSIIIHRMKNVIWIIFQMREE